MHFTNIFQPRYWPCTYADRENSVFLARIRLLVILDFSALRGILSPTHIYKPSVVYSIRRHMIAKRDTLPYTGLQGDVVSDAVAMSASA